MDAFFSRLFNTFSTSTVTPPPAATPRPASLLDKASDNAKGLLYLNQTTLVDLEGNVGVGAKHALFVCAPLAKNEPEELEACYQTLFQEALAKGAETLVVPTFSTGEEGYDPDEAACIAIKQAFQFLLEHPDERFHIFFAIYQNEDGSHSDKSNADAYQEALNKFAPDYLDQRSRLTCVQTQIQYFPADMVVIPVGVHFKGVGAVYKAISQAFQQKAPHDFTITPIMSMLSPSTKGIGVPQQEKMELAIAPESGWGFVLAGDPQPALLPHLDCQSINSLRQVSRFFQHAYTKITFTDLSALCTLLSHSTSKDILLLMRNNASFRETITKAAFTADHLRSLLPYLGSKEITTLIVTSQ